MEKLELIRLPQYASGICADVKMLFGRARRLFIVFNGGIQAEASKGPARGTRGLRVDWCSRHRPRHCNVVVGDVSWALLSNRQMRRRRRHFPMELSIATPAAVCPAHASLKPRL
jgi:hypothetical protein